MSTDLVGGSLTSLSLGSARVVSNWVRIESSTLCHGSKGAGRALARAGQITSSGIIVKNQIDPRRLSSPSPRTEETEVQSITKTVTMT